MVFCSNCGAQLSEDAYFCSKCGSLTQKGKEAGASIPLDDFRDTFHKIGREMEKTFQTATEEIQKAFRSVRENIQEPASKKGIVCPDCGKENLPDSTYCYECGKKLK